jgi:hypothetical protein
VTGLTGPRPAIDTPRALEALKIEALATGLRADEATLALLGGAEALTVHEYATTGGIPLRVGGLDINVPFDEWYCDRATIELVLAGNALSLRHDGIDWPVDHVYPLPGYLGTTDARGNRVDDVVFTHLDRFRLSPIMGCAYDCAFCDLPGRIVLRPLDQLLDAAEVAMADPVLPVRHALISGGSPGPKHEEAFADMVVALVRQLSPRLEVDVMMAPNASGPQVVQRLVEAGVHGFSLNLEVASDAGALHIRGKHRRSHPHFDATVDTAVGLLGCTGRVRSLILPGLEAAEDTLAGVERIAALGADPVLSPFRPARSTVLEHHEPVAAQLLREVLDGAREIVARHGVRLGPRCLPCQHNTLTFPWDAA